MGWSNFPAIYLLVSAATRLVSKCFGKSRTLVRLKPKQCKGWQFPISNIQVAKDMETQLMEAIPKTCQYVIPYMIYLQQSTDRSSQNTGYSSTQQGSSYYQNPNSVYQGGSRSSRRHWIKVRSQPNGIWYDHIREWAGTSCQTMCAYISDFLVFHSPLNLPI